MAKKKRKQSVADIRLISFPEKRETVFNKVQTILTIFIFIAGALLENCVAGLTLISCFNAKLGKRDDVIDFYIDDDKSNDNDI